MIDPDLLALAKQGNAIAIRTLLNRALRAQGIWVRVESQADTLHIAVESIQAPAADSIAPRLCSKLTRLHPRGITTIVVSGWALGDQAPTWERHIHLGGPAIAREPGSSTLNAREPAAFPLPGGQAVASRRPRAVPPRSPHRRQPWVLKGSDFDPMLLAIVGCVAVYGLLGSLNPSYDEPFIWLHYPNLAIHETGHLLFMPFGTFLMLLGGSLTQIAFPAVFTGYFFYSQQFFSSALTLFWTGQNFMDVAVYMRDAPVRQLPLTVDNIDAHDWWQLFNRMDCLQYADSIADVTHGIGVLLYLASVVAGGYLAYRPRRYLTAD